MGKSQVRNIYCSPPPFRRAVVGKLSYQSVTETSSCAKAGFGKKTGYLFSYTFILNIFIMYRLSAVCVKDA